MSRTFTTKYQNTCPALSGAGVLQLRGAPSAIKDGNLTITPVMFTGSEYFGAEVAGVDWTRAVPEDVVKQVITATFLKPPAKVPNTSRNA